MALIKSICEFKNYIGKNVYIVNSGEIFVASTTKREINNELKKLEADEIDSIIFSIDDPNTIIYGIVLNPKELPYEIPEQFNKMTLYLLNEGFGGNILDCTPYNNLEDITAEIESMIEDDFDIEDFAVILGKPIKASLQIIEPTTAIEEKKVYM